MQAGVGVDEYKTVSRQSEIEIVISKSRFIGRCFPCSDEAEALSIIEELKKKHWDASHNCYAYSIGKRRERGRFSDDGEPSGTAGAPMMDALKKNDVTDVVYVVTRYFGGTLLGAGGLVRAYSKSCSEAIKEAGIVSMQEHELLAFEMQYPYWARISDTFFRYGEMESTDFTDIVSVKLWVPNNAVEAFTKEVLERTDAKIIGSKVGSGYRPTKEQR